MGFGVHFPEIVYCIEWLRELWTIKGTLESSATSSSDSWGNNSLGHTTCDKVACYIGGPS